MRPLLSAGIALAVMSALAACDPSRQELWQERAAETREEAEAAGASAAQLALIDQGIDQGHLTYAEVDTLWPDFEACLLARHIVIEDVEFASAAPGIRVQHTGLTYVPLSPPITGEEIEECRSTTHWFAQTLVREDDEA